MQPAQVGLQPEHDAFQEQRCVGILFLFHHREPYFSQAAQQVAALRVDEADRVGEGALRGGDELHVELGEVGPRPAQVRHPFRHPLLAGGSQAVNLAVGPLGRRVDELSERALAYLRRDEIGFVFQTFQLMDELTAQENVELPALLAGCTPGEARTRATALLEQVGLADRARHLPSMLSGGQRQRVAIARALVNDPGIVLADEPTGNLDTASAFDVLSLLSDLHAKGLTLVIVTHDERIATTADT